MGSKVDILENIKVLGYRVLIKPDDPEVVSEGGIVLVQDERKARASIDTGTIVAIGPSAWKQIDPKSAPWAKVGDKVLYVKFSQKIITLPNDPESTYYSVVNDDDVLVILEAKS